MGRATVGGGAVRLVDLSSTWVFPGFVFRCDGGLAPRSAKFLAGLVDGLADIAKHFSRLGDQRGGLLVKTLDQLAQRNHRRKQLAAIFVAGETAEEFLGLAQ